MATLEELVKRGRFDGAAINGGLAEAARETIAGRLRLAINGSRYPDVKSFQEAIHGQGVKGASKGSVQSYLDGSTLPGVGFLEAAAALLGVSAAWLAFGASDSRRCAECEWRERRMREAVALLTEGRVRDA